MEGPESKAPADPIEAPRPEAGAPEKVEKPLDEIGKEHDEKREEQRKRDAEEKPAHEQEAQSAESLLDQEINAEAFEDMANSLTGDAKEVYEAVQTILTPEDRAAIGKLMQDFTSFSNEQFGAMREKLGQGDKESYIAAMKAKNGAMMANTFQNSIDNILREAQDKKKDDPKNEAERFAQELNERNNQEFRGRVNEGGKAAWNKLWDAVEAHVREEVRKNPNRVFTGARKQGEMGSGNDRLLGRASDIIGAETLMKEAEDMKRDGVKVVLKTKDGDRELSDVKSISAEKEVQMELGIPQGMDAATLEKAMTSEGSTRTVNLGDRLVFTGTAAQLREGLQEVQEEQDKAKKAGK